MSFPAYRGGRSITRLDKDRKFSAGWLNNFVDSTGERLAGPVDIGGGRIWFLQFSPSGDLPAGTHSDQSAVYIWDHHFVELILVKVPYTFPGRQWLDGVRWMNDRRERVIAGCQESLVVIDTTTTTTSLKQR